MMNTLFIYMWLPIGLGCGENKGVEGTENDNILMVWSFGSFVRLHIFNGPTWFWSYLGKLRYFIIKRLAFFSFFMDKAEQLCLMNEFRLKSLFSRTRNISCKDKEISVYFSAEGSIDMIE